MIIHVPTMMVAILVLCTMLCLSIGWVSWREGGDGLRALTLALGFHALGYATFIAGGFFPLPLELFIRNFSISASSSLMIFALAHFYKQPVRIAALLLLPFVLGITCALFTNHLNWRLVITSTVATILDLTMLWSVWLGQKKRHGHAHVLFCAGIVLNLALMAGRAIGVLMHADPAQTPTDSTTIEGLLYLSALISLNLIAVGFVLMTKEASDEALRRQATTDKLTGIANRSRLEDEVRQEILLLRRYGTPLSLLLLDIDHFKQINDRYGHLNGDAVLQEVVTSTRLYLRETDVLGRWGGEEFVVLLPSTGLQVAIGVADRIRSQIAETDFSLGAPVTVSIGVASCRASDDLANFFERADAALYRAKDGGRNRVEVEVPLEQPISGGATQGLLKLVWGNAMATGHPEMDAQHRALFESANHLLDLALRGTEPQSLNPFIIHLMNQFAKHFADEELLLADVGWDELPEHAAQHKALITRSHELLEKYANNKLGLSELLHFIVYEVIAQHILIEDLRYRPSSFPMTTLST
jgi:diguanylate cyclase (GGDEF)-like protein/hemerythrin-like metal-binding protein